ncbi:Rv1733c family protein [Streptomyces noursei]|uniref:Rv1733c family protein n=1 Tax=Streptomyces noursei TaxID=1971 RepID=UPI0037F60959
MAPRTLHQPWRHGPLRRRTDLAQSWMALVSGLLIAVAAPAAGVLAGNAVDAAVHGQRADRHSTVAVVTKTPPAALGVAAGNGTVGRAYTVVRWTAPNGTVRTGETAVPPGARAGDRTTVWLDGRGALIRDPGSPEDTVVESVAVGIVAASGTGLALFAVHKGGVRLLDRRRYAQWEKEWAELDARPRRDHP